MAKTGVLSSPVSDPTSISLSRILSSLERTLLSAESDPRLRKSSYERAKVGANLEHARLLLLRLEHDSTGVQGQARKQSIQNSLQTKREIVKQLNKRLSELNQLDDSDEDSDVSSEDDDETKAFPSYAPARLDTSAGIDREHNPGNSSAQQAAATLTSTLRSRRPQSTAVDTTTSATGTSLFPKRTTKPTADPTLAESETLLSHNRAEQENLTGSLLSMAQALKSQSMEFGTTLESEKSVLNRAAEGLDKNTKGMESAGRRMTSLRRMTEGKSWWERMLTYAMIAGLWVVLILVVALVPKLR